MFDLGGTELLLVGIVALIVVGPKDLPGMFRAVGRFTGKARGMAREFSSAMNAAADEAGVKDISNTIKAAANPRAFGMDKLREASGLGSTLGSTPVPPAGTPLATRPPIKPGGATEALAAERAEAKRKITEATARAATERKAREAALAAEPVAPAAPAKPKKTRAKAAPAATTDVAPPPAKAATAKPKTSRKRADAAKPDTAK